MPRDPVADDGGELTDLKRESSVLPWGESEGVFVEPDLSAVITWIEAAVESRLGKEIDLRAELGIKEECQARVKQIVDFAVDQSRRGLFKVITFDVDRAA